MNDNYNQIFSQNYILKDRTYLVESATVSLESVTKFTNYSSKGLTRTVNAIFEDKLAKYPPNVVWQLDVYLYAKALHDLNH